MLTEINELVLERNWQFADKLVTWREQFEFVFET